MKSPEITLDEIVNAGPMAAIPDPYRLYTRLRNESPVVQMPGSTDGGAVTVLVTRYEDVRAILKDNETFVNAILQITMGLVLGPTIIGMDGAEHTKHRTLITPALSPKALGGDFPDFVERTAHEIIGGFASKGSADIRSDFTSCYPLTVLVRILGLPAEDVRQFHDWAVDLTLVGHDPPKGIAASQKMLEYLTPIIARKRAEPGSDLISELVTAKINGSRLADLDVVSFLRLLVLAGAETTYHLLGSVIYVLLKDPDLMDRVLVDRSLVSALIAETMRWEAPISTVLRQASRDTEISGVSIAAGTNVLCHLGSANRDERQFPDPDVFDIDRLDTEHIAFGFGKHFCAGSRLALLEAEVGVNAILDRLPNLRAQAGENFCITGFAFRGPDRLPVEFDFTG